MRPPLCIREKISSGKYDTPQAVKAAILNMEVPHAEQGQMAAFLTALKSYMQVVKKGLVYSSASVGESHREMGE